MTEHTPTPWRAYCGFVESYAIAAGESLSGLYVADCRMTDESEANAAFIVRAVNAHDGLVKALTRCVEAWDSLPRGNHSTREVSDWLASVEWREAMDMSRFALSSVSSQDLGSARE